MGKYFSFIAILYFNVCSAQDFYSYTYKYFIRENTTSIPSFDSAYIAQKVTDDLTNNAYLQGVAYKNGTLLRLYVEDSKVEDSVKIHDDYSVNLNINATNKSGDLYTFYSKNNAVQFNAEDTNCFYIDSSIEFYATLTKKIINNQECIEYKSNSEGYQYFSIWVCKKLPAAISPGIFHGINSGIVEIDNNKKRGKIALINYSKNVSTNIYAIQCLKEIGRGYRFIDFVK